MSDFPSGSCGDIATTRMWLDKKGFTSVFVGWEADAILGLDKTDILATVPGENGLKLWGYLNTARKTGKPSIIPCHPQLSLSLFYTSLASAKGGISAHDDGKILKALAEIKVGFNELTVDSKSVGFAMKAMTDALPPNLGVVVPSEDCKTDKSGKYRALMRALRLPEDNDLAGLAAPVTFNVDGVEDFTFSWEDHPESASYLPFITYLWEKLKLRGVNVSEGAGLPDKLLYVSDIYTLRPKLGELAPDLTKEAMKPQFRFRVRGRTDVAVFRTDGIHTCGDLLLAFEIKSKFTNVADVNRALREGVLQLVGTNADNQYASPLVIVTGLGKRHFLLYLDICDNPQQELRYYLRVKSCNSLVMIIRFAQQVLLRGCVTARFCAPPTPTGSPPSGTPDVSAQEDKDEDDDSNGDNFDEANVALLSLDED